MNSYAYRLFLRSGIVQLLKTPREIMFCCMFPMRKNYQRWEFMKYLNENNITTMAPSVPMTTAFLCTKCVASKYLYCRQLNWLRPGDGYIRLWMGHHWFRHWLVTIKWNAHHNTTVFFPWNIFDDVSQVAVNMSRDQSVEFMFYHRVYNHGKVCRHTDRRTT